MYYQQVAKHQKTPLPESRIIAGSSEVFPHLLFAGFWQFFDCDYSPDWLMPGFSYANAKPAIIGLQEEDSFFRSVSCKIQEITHLSIYSADPCI